MIPSIILSDNVIREHGTGKLSLIGTFQGFALPNFPAQIPGFWITVYLTNLRPVPHLSLTARLEQEGNGNVIASAVANINFDPVSVEKLKSDTLIEIPIRYNNIILPAPGKYSVVILVDGSHVTSRPLQVTTHQPQLPLK